MRISCPRLIAATTMAFAVAVDTVEGQIDYRNLDDGRPTRVTDVVPIERYAFELSIPYRIGLVGGAANHAVTPTLEYGMFRNVSVGLGLDLDLGGGGGEATRGHASVIYNPLRETPSLPGFALVAEASGRAFDQISVAVGALATRSFGRSRVHLNLLLTPLRPDGRSPRTEPTWWAGVGWDRTLLRTSTLVVVDLSAGEVTGGGEAIWEMGAGLRRQMTPTLVWHGGVARDLNGADPVTRFTFGVSHAFAVSGLMRRVVR